jgi:hypothetical protein
MSSAGTQTQTQPIKCYQCGQNNPSQAFCGGCGSPLALNDYIAKKVKDQIAETIRDRDILEMESSIKVFTQAWGWIKLIIGTAAGLLILAGGGVIWKASDFWSGVDKAKQSVTDTAKKSTDEIASYTAQSKQDMAAALSAGEQDISASAAEAAQQSKALKQTASRTQADISRQSVAVRGDIEKSRLELQAANKMQPEMENMRQQLAQATAAIQAQQKVISSSEDFVKSVFSSHAVEIFTLGTSPKDRYVAVPPASKDIKNTVVLMLLNATPIQGTLALQYHIFAQPPNSYFNIHNLVFFFWGDPTDNLREHPLSVSYFPDKSDKEIIRSLSEHDGRIFADDQPLPKWDQPDPDFKGNKWMPVVTNPPLGFTQKTQKQH